MKIEYKVRPVTRYVVTRYEESEGGRTGSSSVKGQYDNEHVAYEVAYALAKEESGRTDIGVDELFYPDHPDIAKVQQASL
jgi:hypothetical protein